MKKNKNKLHRFIKEDLKNKGISIPKELLDLRKSYDSTEIKQLISYNDFKKFLLELTERVSNKKRQIIVTTNALQLRSKRFTNYADIYSNKQFKTLYNMNNTQLNAMLNYFVGQEDAEIISTMIKNNKTDDYILKYIKNHLNFKNTIDIKNFKNSKIANFIYRNFLKGKKNPYILDIGVGNGKKIKSICSYLNPDYEIFGADIEEWGSYSKNRKFDFTYKVIQMNPYKIPYTDKMFDCITIILTLHHAENILDVIKECYRLLKDDGCVILVEHDVWTDETNMLVDLQHRIYTIINNEPLNGSIATYYNYYEWDILFSKCGFKPIISDHIEEDIAFNIRYDVENIIGYCKKDYKYTRLIEK